MHIEYFFVVMFGMIMHLSYSLNIKKTYFGKKCEPIRVEACKGLLYNFTIFPNHMGHSLQEEAELEINQYLPLTKINCSPSLKLFLCSLYFPVCTIMKNPLQPCKSLCIQNRLGCEPVIKRFNFKWPENMNCDFFPENKLCLRENKTSAIKSNQFVSKEADQTELSSHFMCPTPLKVPSRNGYYLRIGYSHVEPDCGIPCHQHFFAGSQSQYFARMWIGLWSFLCLISTLFTVLTFAVNMKRFQYPERPIIFLTACYFMVSLTYVIGFILKDRFACSGPFPTPDSLRVPQQEMPRLISQGIRSEGCILLFMILYFFSMASNIWWVVLTITWYLAAKCHWAHEAIARNSQYFHLAAWALPALQTIGVLTWGEVDGDPLSGVCFTGLSNPQALRIFLIAPLCTYLIIGTGFLIAGFVSMFKIRTIIKTEGAVKTDKLEKLIIRIGMFSVLYILPAVIVIACYLHESQKHAVWSLSWYFEQCRRQRRFMPSVCAAYERRLVAMGGTSALKKPEFELFMIKYLMTLVVGITSGIWIWTGKTLHSWKSFCLRITSTNAASNDIQMPCRLTNNFSANRYQASVVTSFENQPMVCWSPSQIGEPRHTINSTAIDTV